MKQSILIILFLFFCIKEESFAQEKKMLNDLKNLKQGEYILKKGNIESCSPGFVRLKDSNLLIGSNTIFVNINNGKTIDVDAGEDPAKNCRYETTVTTQFDRVLQTQNYYCGSNLLYTSNIVLTVNNNVLNYKQIDHWAAAKRDVVSFCEYALKKFSQLKLVPKASDREPARFESISKKVSPNP